MRDHLLGMVGALERLGGAGVRDVPAHAEADLEQAQHARVGRELAAVAHPWPCQPLPLAVLARLLGGGFTVFRVVCAEQLGVVARPADPGDQHEQQQRRAGVRLRGHVAPCRGEQPAR